MFVNFRQLIAPTQQTVSFDVQNGAVYYIYWIENCCFSGALLQQERVSFHV